MGEKGRGAGSDRAYNANRYCASSCCNQKITSLVMAGRKPCQLQCEEPYATARSQCVTACLICTPTHTEGKKWKGESMRKMCYHRSRSESRLAPPCGCASLPAAPLSYHSSLSDAPGECARRETGISARKRTSSRCNCESVWRPLGIRGHMTRNLLFSRMHMNDRASLHFCGRRMQPRTVVSVSHSWDE